MDIAEVAKASGLPSSTLRFYEEKGLIQSNRSSGLRRQYGGNILERLALISLGRNAGFSLDEIVAMFTPAGPDINRELLSAKADELDSKIKELTAMRDGLRHAADCKASSHFECPKFLRLLRVAGKNRFRKPNNLKEKKWSLTPFMRSHRAAICYAKNLLPYPAPNLIQGRVNT